MSARAALIAVLAYQFAAMAMLCMLIAVTLRGLLTELGDDVRASRNENRNEGGTMSTKNRKVRDYHSTQALRAANAVLAARVDAQAMLSDARQLAAELAMPVRGMR
jgi:hypothetical protein